MDNYTEVDNINQTNCSAGVATMFTVALSLISFLASTCREPSCDRNLHEDRNSEDEF